MAYYFYIVTAEIDRKPETFTGTVTEPTENPARIYDSVTDDVCRTLLVREDIYYPRQADYSRAWGKVDAVMFYYVKEIPED